MDNATQSALLFALLPVIAVIGLSLNLFIRARGGRSFVLRLKGFGIDLTVESVEHKLKSEGHNDDSKE